MSVEYLKTATGEYWVIEGTPGEYRLLRLEVKDDFGNFEKKFVARDVARKWSGVAK